MSDWYPGTRDGALNMAKVWITVLAKNASARGIPTDEISDMAELISAAAAILATSKGADRTSTILPCFSPCRTRLSRRFRPIQGQPALDTRSDYGYKIYYGAMPQGGATVEQATGKRHLLMKAPTTGDEPPRSVWTRRKNDKMDFHETRGSTVYFCIRYENAKRESGPWGNIFSAIVP